MTHREHIEWCDIWITSAGAASKRPRVLLVGDSIARSYYPHVAQHFSETFACARLASSKCVSDPLFTKELDLVLEEYEFAIIHFNNGLHGWEYDESAYGLGMSQAIDHVQSRCGAASLILANTTPVWSKNQRQELDARTARVRERNRILSDLATERDLPVNDLFEAVIDHPDYFSKDGVHFTDSGQAKLGEWVSRAIQDAEEKNAAD